MKGDIPDKIVINFKHSQADGGIWATCAFNNHAFGAHGFDRKGALVRLAKAIEASNSIVSRYPNAKGEWKPK